ncbi:MAG: NUDIX hydrolase [Planctomycetes bacterium]|nr:NUDIX hydrolase [Planctomycetota bacterium]
MSSTHAFQPWDVLSSVPLLSAPPWLEISRQEVRLPGGKVLSDFYRVGLPDFTLVVPVVPGGEVVMVRGYKHGLGCVSLGLPGGLLEPGEAPLEGARRELLEETGYTAERWAPLGSFVVDANRHCGTLHAFLALDARPDRPAADDETERLAVCLMDRGTLTRALAAGEVHGLASACALGLGLLRGW